MPHSWELNRCCVCGKQLAPDDFDGFCSECDTEEEAEQEEAMTERVNAPQIDRFIEGANIIKRYATDGEIELKFAVIYLGYGANATMMTDEELARLDALGWQYDERQLSWYFSDVE